MYFAPFCHLELNENLLRGFATYVCRTSIYENKWGTFAKTYTKIKLDFYKK